MSIQKTALLLLLVSFAMAAAAQKVRRKGMPPIDITKNKKGRKTPQYTFTVEQFDGKWQEVSRKDKSGNVVEFTDTIYLHFTGNGKVITRDGNAVNMSGSAVLEAPGNILLVAADVYAILSANDSIAELDDQNEFVHVLKKTNRFRYEDYGKLSVKQETFSDPVSITLNDVLGKWMVYRKVASPGAIHPPVNIITYLKITDSTGENTAKGEITFYQTDKSTVLPCVIKVANAGLDIIAGEYNWQLFVYKADKKELVFGDAAVLLYYAKSY